MAQTWPIQGTKRIVLAAADAIDALGRPLAELLARRNGGLEGPVRKILVVELWHIGDVVLTTPLLRVLRQWYPDAEISFLGKPHAEEVLRESGLVDRVFEYDFPWTATVGKYQPGRYDHQTIGELFSRLRAERFDLTIDCRMDGRSNAVTFATGARRRIGYAFGGGSFLLTDALPANPDEYHKVRDWLELLRPLNGHAPAPWQNGSDPVHVMRPFLRVSDAERQAARRLLQHHGIAPEDRVLGVHPGGSHSGKRWQLERFARIADVAASEYGMKLAIIVDPEGYGNGLPVTSPAAFVRTSLREMMAVISHCDLLLCNDSAPMHIAAALGVPVLAVFTTGNPKWYGPVGDEHMVVGSGAPRGKTSDVPLDDVLRALETQLSRLGITSSAFAATEP